MYQIEPRTVKVQCYCLVHARIEVRPKAPKKFQIEVHPFCREIEEKKAGNFRPVPELPGPKKSVRPKV